MTKTLHQPNSTKGNKYEKVADKPLKDIAKMIKKEIKQEFPDIKVSVTSDTYTGGQSITAKIKEYPYELNTDAFKEYKETDQRQTFKRWTRENNKPHQRRTDKAKDVLDGIKQIAYQYNYDNSNIQTDYYDKHFTFFVKHS